MYQLSDFKPQYSWCWTDLEGGSYSIHRSPSGDWMVAPPGKSWEDLVDVSSLHQAKAFLIFKYGLPMTGWKAYHSKWISKDNQWFLSKTTGKDINWFARNIPNGKFSKSFKSRQAAVEWINQYEQGGSS